MTLKPLIHTKLQLLGPVTPLVDMYVSMSDPKSQTGAFTKTCTKTNWSVYCGVYAAGYRIWEMCMECTAVCWLVNTNHSLV